MRETQLGFQPPAIGEEEIEAVAATLRSGWLTTGPSAALLEERMAEYLEAKHVLAVASGTAAMHLALDFALGEEASVVSTQSLVGGACVHFLVAPEGRLVETEGREVALGVDGVLDVRLYREPGHVFGPLLRGPDRAGAVIAVGDSRGQALERARAAADEIRFVVE